MSSSSAPAPTQSPPATAWDDVGRIEEWAGEIRVNLIRIIGIVLFYGRHLLEFFMASPGSDIRGAFHLRVTWLVAVWALSAALLHAQLHRRRVMPSLKFMAVALDLFMVTLLCMIADGPKSPLVLLYFLVIAASALRLSLALVYAATAGAIAAYLCLLAHYAWHVIGSQVYYSTPGLRIPRSTEGIYGLSMLVAGLLAGQVVRQARRIASGYSVTMVSRREEG